MNIELLLPFLLVWAGLCVMVGVDTEVRCAPTNEAFRGGHEPTDGEDDSGYRVGSELLRHWGRRRQRWHHGICLVVPDDAVVPDGTVGEESVGVTVLYGACHAISFLQCFTIMLYYGRVTLYYLRPLCQQPCGPWGLNTI